MKRTLIFLLFCSTGVAQVPPPPAASQAEVIAGLVKTKYVSPATLLGGGFVSSNNPFLLIGESNAATAAVDFPNAVGFTNSANYFTGNGGGLTNVPAESVNAVNVSIGRYLWKNTRSKILASQPFHWLQIGDSIATIDGTSGNSHGSWLGQMRSNYVAEYGTSGYGTPCDSDWYSALSGGAVTLTDGTIWFAIANSSTGGILTNGAGTVTYASDTISGGPLGNFCQIYYIAQNGAGTFKVQTNLNSGGWVDVSGLTAVSANNSGSAAGVALTVFSNSVANNTQVRATAVSGSVVILSAQIRDATVTGIETSYFANGGSNIYDYVSIPTNINGPILRAMAPDLITVAFRDDANYYNTNLIVLRNLITNWAPNADIVFLGVWPTSTLNNNWNISNLQNISMRSNSILLGLPYFDGWNIFPDYTNGLRSGVFSSAIDPHLPFAGQTLYANNLSRWLDLESSQAQGTNSAYAKTIQTPLLNGSRVYTNMTASGPDPITWGNFRIGVGTPGTPGIAVYHPGSDATYFYSAAGGFNFQNVANSSSLTLADNGVVTISNLSLTVPTNNAALGSQVGNISIVISNVSYKIPLYR